MIILIKLIDKVAVHLHAHSRYKVGRTGMNASVNIYRGVSL